MHRAFLLTLLLLFSFSSNLLAGNEHGKASCPSCNSCDYVCQFSTVKSKEKKTEYDVECKAICIPAITFPWEKHAGKGKDSDCAEPPRCGKVKMIHVMVKHEYECTRCKCKWTAVPVGGKKAGDYNDSGHHGLQPPPVHAESPQPSAPIPVVRPPDFTETPRKLPIQFSNFGADISRRFISALR